MDIFNQLASMQLQPEIHNFAEQKKWGKKCSLQIPSSGKASSNNDVLLGHPS